MEDFWDREETADERAQREMCEGWRDDLMRTSPIIRFMTKHLRLLSCDPAAQFTASQSPSSPPVQAPAAPSAQSGSSAGPRTRSPAPDPRVPKILIAPCPSTIAGGFSPSSPDDPSQSGILLCSNRMMSKKHMEDTLAHEMIHWWDHCRFKVDWADLKHHACSEIRAASLSGDCRWPRELRRGFYTFTKQHQACARRRAIISVRANPNCPDDATAERTVDEVWESCFKDTRPFDEIY